jgi:protein gp37
MAAPNVRKDDILETFIRLSKINHIRMEKGKELHTFLILTKFPHLLFQAIDEFAWEFMYKRNIYIGTTLTGEDPDIDRRRILDLTTFGELYFKIWLSIEPILGPILPGNEGLLYQPDQVIAGGETGPYAGRWDPDWLEGLYEACRMNETPFFFKNWGRFALPDDNGMQGRPSTRPGVNRSVYNENNKLIWANK